MIKICPYCFSYLLTHPTIYGWVQCPNCAFACKTEKSMITIQELNISNFKTTPEIEANLKILLDKMNKLRTAYGKPMIVTSGLRDLEKHKEIYKKKGIPENKTPMGSKHLSGQACDIGDSKKELQEWCKKNEKVLEEIGLWCESFDATPTWCHFQSISPRSKSRFFKP